MFLRIIKADWIVFQLIQKDLSNSDSQWTEKAVFPMAVKPKVLAYHYGSRSAIVQTTPDKGFIDRYGSQLTTVTMSGTFAVQPRLIGLSFQDGYTRLLNFRDELFKVSQQARQQKSDGNAQYVYAVNYYDFINDERFSINLDDFTIETDATRNSIEPTYQLKFTSLGPVISEVLAEDPMLAMLNGFSDAIDSTLASVQSFLDNNISSNSNFQKDEGAITAIEECQSLWTELGTLGALYATALATQIVSAASSSSVFKNDFENNPVSETAQAFVSVKG